MLKYIFQRLFWALGTLITVIIILSSIIYIAPVDPTRLSFGQRSDAKTVELLKKKLKLDAPLHVQLFYYLSDISPIHYLSKEDDRLQDYAYIEMMSFQKSMLILKKPYLRNSYQNGRNVSSMLVEAIPNTLVLGLASIALAAILGMLLGVVAALKYNTAIDHGITSISVLGYSVPSYISAIAMSLIFGFSLGHLTHLEIQGSLWEYDDLGNKMLQWKNCILPALALGIRPVGMITQMTRSAVLDVIQQDYIRTAHSKGLSARTVAMTHTLPNAANPILTTLSAWLASLLTGSFFVEYIFNYKGLGNLTVNALKTFDIPVILGASLFTVLLFVCITIITDLLYAYFDPRIRLND